MKKNIIIALAVFGCVFGSGSVTHVEAAPPAHPAHHCQCQHTKYSDEQFKALASAAYKAGQGARPTFSSEKDKSLARAKVMAETLPEDFRTFFWQGYNS